jgi:pyoverdine/dityrosine biosynthesis protein Dit1
MSVKARQRVERMVCRRFILDAVHAGYAISVDDGEEVVLHNSTNVREILSKMFSVDDERLYVMKDGKRFGWVRLIYGNDGWDVISDYSTNLESLMRGAAALADVYSQ